MSLLEKVNENKDYVCSQEEVCYSRKIRQMIKESEFKIYKTSRHMWNVRRPNVITVLSKDIKEVIVNGRGKNFEDCLMLAFGRNIEHMYSKTILLKTHWFELKATMQEQFINTTCKVNFVVPDNTTHHTWYDCINAYKDIYFYSIMFSDYTILNNAYIDALQT
jgi:hypothetical protein